MKISTIFLDCNTQNDYLEYYENSVIINNVKQLINKTYRNNIPLIGVVDINKGNKIEDSLIIDPIYIEQDKEFNDFDMIIKYPLYFKHDGDIKNNKNFKECLEYFEVKNVILFGCQINEIFESLKMDYTLFIVSDCIKDDPDPKGLDGFNYVNTEIMCL